MIEGEKESKVEKIGLGCLFGWNKFNEMLLPKDYGGQGMQGGSAFDLLVCLRLSTRATWLPILCFALANGI